MINKFNLLKKLRKKLLDGNYTIGTWQQIPNSSVSEILSNAGYDWIVIDMEHGSISINQLPDLFRAIELTETLPFVRLPEANPKECQRVLDAGACGIILPMINSSNQLSKIKDACYWPPAGNRGVGFSRANLFGKNFDLYAKLAQAPFLVAQIEHIDAVNNLDEIFSVDGLDAILVGPYDLSASMNLTGDFNHEDYNKILKKIINLSKKYNIPCGNHIVNSDSKEIIKSIEDGFRFIAYCTDGIFLNDSSTISNTLNI